jgi:hypothetical protein
MQRTDPVGLPLTWGTSEVNSKVPGLCGQIPSVNVRLHPEMAVPQSQPHLFGIVRDWKRNKSQIKELALAGVGALRETNPDTPIAHKPGHLLCVPPSLQQEEGSLGLMLRKASPVKSVLLQL